MPETGVTTIVTKLIGAVAIAALLTISTAQARDIDGVEGQHGLANFGDLKYPADFTHFDYANPNAPKGGSLHQAVVSDGFDSFNVVPPKGHPAAGIGLLYETLLVHSGDEAFSEYGALAEEVFLPEDRSWVAFSLREEARWHDGRPVTADDVIFSFNALIEHGAPLYKLYYGDVAEVEKLDERTVRFRFSTTENKELPLILGQITVLPKHYWESRDITRTTLEVPLGSGPYKIKNFEANRFVTYERVEDYWGKDIPVNRGRHNFDELRYDYYADSSVAQEAFKAGEFDFRLENTAKDWALAYDIPAVRNGRIVKQTFEDKTAQVMLGLIFNMRKGKFADRRVRKALTTIYDHEWSNQNLFFNQYTHLRSFFGDGDLAAKGLPKGRELEILNQYRDQLPPEVFTQEYNPPKTDRPHGLRENLLMASRLLDDAGWVIDPDTLMRVNAETGEPYEIEILMSSSTLQRVLLPIARNLKRLGIEAKLNVADSSQYIKRVRDRDFDMIWLGWAQSLSPGNEQREFWSSGAADNPASRNYAGLKNPVVDALIEDIIVAPTREELEARTRALDRVLQWQYLLVPGYYSMTDRIVRWNKFGLPETQPWDGYDLTTWWYDEELAREHNLAEGS